MENEPSPRSYNASSVTSSKNVSRRNSTAGQDRKKKDVTTQKIQELKTIIPAAFFENKEKSSGTKDGTPNKGQILQMAIDYVTHLQKKIDENNKKEIELIIILNKLEELKKVPEYMRVSKTMFKNTSAEIALSEIGVGPLAAEKEENAQRQSLEMTKSGSGTGTGTRTGTGSGSNTMEPAASQDMAPDFSSFVKSEEFGL